MRVSIKNFQSIGDIDFKIEGFTAITGKSNIGKSAIWRALEGALFGRSGDGCVKDGTALMQVHVEDDGLDVLWEKGKDVKGANRYTLNQTDTYSALPTEIQDVGYRVIDIGDKKTKIQFSNQHSPLFLIDPEVTSGSQAANVLISVSRMEELLEATRRCNSELRENKQRKKVREGDLKRVTEQISKTEGIEEISKKVFELGIQKDSIQSLSEEVEHIKGTHEDLIRLLSEIDLLSPVADWGGIDTSSLDDRDLIALKRVYASLQESDGIESLEVSDFPSTLGFLDALDKDERSLHVYRDLRKAYDECKDVLTLTNFPDTSVQIGLDVYNKLVVARSLTEEILVLEEQFHSLDVGMCPMCGKEVDQDG